MEETQREPQVATSSATEQSDEARPQGTTVLPTARLLANPRRIRRD
jgi:hypothetical protein